MSGILCALVLSHSQMGSVDGRTPEGGGERSPPVSLQVFQDRPQLLSGGPSYKSGQVLGTVFSFLILVVTSLGLLHHLILAILNLAHLCKERHHETSFNQSLECANWSVYCWEPNGHWSQGMPHRDGDFELCPEERVRFHQVYMHGVGSPRLK